MLSLKNIFFILLGIMLLTIIVNVFFKFLGIEFASYGNYLLWVIALVLFFMILDGKKEDLFA